MRAIEIAIFILVINAAVVFTTDIGLFGEEGYLEHSEYTRNQYSTVNITENLSGYGEIGQNPSTWDYFKISVTWAIEAMIMFIKIVFSVVFVYPILVKVFYIPNILSAFLQVGVWAIYIIGLFQWKAKVSAKHMI